MGLNIWNKAKRLEVTEAPTPTISTPMTSEKTSATSATSQRRRTMKTRMAVDGGKTKRTRNIRRVNREQFELIHLLYERGLKRVEIANVVKLSAQRVGYIINHCPTWEIYEERKRKEVLALQKKKAEKAIQHEEEHHEERELEQWQFIVGWSNESQRIHANAVRDLARALGLKVEE